MSLRAFLSLDPFATALPLSDSAAPAADSAAYDVIIVGAGAAGLYTGLCLPSHYRVAILSKDLPQRSASDWAQGGLAAVTAPDDSADLHYADTLQAGAGLCEPAAVRLLVESAPHCVASLLDLGVAFDRTNDHLALTLEAAHSRHRVLHAADTTGRAIVTTLLEQVLQRPNLEILAQSLAVDLWRDREGCCCGVLLLQGQQLRWLAARAVILACGGGGQVFSQTTNPALSTGDGVALAGRAGAKLRDLEFFQFHPTALVWPGAPRFLISEAVRGEGAHVVDAQGARFLFRYDDRGELAPRDIVSRAIYRHLLETGTEQVWLDLRPIPAATVEHRFPNILQKCRRWGLDPLQQPLPIAPAAHYWMGGVYTDLSGATTCPGLYAVGETACTGVHGANRLASNSLLECLVFGRQFQQLELPPVQPNDPTDPPEDLRVTGDRDRWQQQRQALQDLVWKAAGICRDADRLQAALAQIEAWQADFEADPLSQAIAAVPVGQAQLLEGLDAEALREWGELRNLLAIAQLILKSANFRTESRGGHYRSDYPQPDPAWQVHTDIQAGQWLTTAIACQ
ncbi:L-aspartate oxidase [Synechococcus elongatus PCC 11802]|uniref:L-aspartate oxidase n=1 Tax=Synechococcus elongatus PCC 11802 TaxID=2283154 RepID=A0AAU6R617_SYNEL|nr:L-aspartate oxidase [Synechococcus elongatus]